jgi:hypothetical protein
VVGGGPRLKNGFLFERPWSGGVDPPAWHTREKRGDRPEIFAVVRPEIQPGALPHPAGEQGKESRLQQAVLMVAFFRPRVGKQDPEFGERHPGGQRLDQFPGLRLDKVTMGELGALGLALRATDPVADEVYAETETLRKFRGVAGKKMSVAGTDFQSDGGCGGNKCGEAGAQSGLAFGDSGEEFGFGSHAPF